jgi:hypothetical protein
VWGDSAAVTGGAPCELDRIVLHVVAGSLGGCGVTLLQLCLKKPL